MAGGKHNQQNSKYILWLLKNKLKQKDPTEYNSDHEETYPKFIVLESKKPSLPKLSPFKIEKKHFFNNYP